MNIDYRKWNFLLGCAQLLLAFAIGGGQSVAAATAEPPVAAPNDRRDNFLRTRVDALRCRY